MNDFILDAFRELETPHVVVGFGKIGRNQNQDDEIQIEVLLLERRPDPDFFKTAHVMPIRIWLGVGKLDLVYCGSVWAKGRREKHRYFFGKPYLEAVTFSNSATLWDHESAAGLMLGDMRCFPFSWEETSVDGKTTGRRLWGWVPMAELVRAIFGVNSHMLIRMFGGIKSRQMAKRTYFYDRVRSRRIDKNTVRLYCWGKPSETEAIVAAASIVEGPFKKAYCSIFQAIQTALESEDHKSTVLAMPKPFEGSVRMSFQGRWLDVSKQPKPKPVQGSFYGHSLVHINWIVIPTPFTRIEIINEQPKASDEPLPTERRLTVGNTNTLMLQDVRAPSSRNASQQLLEKSSDVFPQHEIEIIEMPRNAGGEPFPELMFDAAEKDLGEASTGDPIPGAGNRTFHVNIKRTSRKLTKAEIEEWASQDKEYKGIEAALKEVESAIEIGRENDLWSILHMDVEEVVTPKGNVFVMLFAEVFYKKASVPRHIVLADAGSFPGHPRAMGIICRRDGYQFTSSDHASLRIIAGEKAGSWKNIDGLEAPNFTMNWVARNDVKDVATHYKRLSGKLETLFG